VISGYRRRILIEPSAGLVTAELEDDYHRMVVSLTHAEGVATKVESEMKRSPWTMCPGAMDQLAQTFTGVPLAGFAKRGEKTANCTHLHDLALFAAAHAAETAPVAYDILVTDAADGARRATLARNGAPLLDWALQGEAMGEMFTAPAELAGKHMSQLNEFIATQDRPTAEAVRILRWASIVAHGRVREMPAGMSATEFPLGSCFNFQPDRAPGSTRRPGADIDFSKPGAAPMADRAEAFHPAS
jgi:hypothetical protein